MKPLELTIHPMIQDRQGEDWYVWNGTGMRPYIADMYTDIKRLTDAELAAEYWRAKWTGEISQRKHTFMLTEANIEKINTVERFMALPHASESNYE